jgi:hypothetical protein
LVALAAACLLAVAGGTLAAASPAGAASPADIRSLMVSWAQTELNNSSHNYGVSVGLLYNCNYYTGHFQGHEAGCPSGWHGGDWCADFVHYIWQLAGGVSDLTSIDAWAESFKTYGMNHGTWHATGSGYTPQPGDALVYPDDSGVAGKADHVGIVIAVSGSKVTTIEGNTGSMVTSQNTVSISAAQGFTAPLFSGTTKVRDSIGVYRGSTTKFYLDYNYDGVSEHQIVYGQDGDIPISGNWDGISGHGLGLYRQSEGRFYLDNDNDGVTDLWVKYGGSGDRPIAGNWDGAGSVDGVGAFRVAAGHFYLDENNDGVTDHSFDYGTNGDWPVAGDWDGNGTDGIGVFRPSEGRFYLDANLDGVTDYYVDYGTAGDRPLSRTVG